MFENIVSGVWTRKAGLLAQWGAGSVSEITKQRSSCIVAYENLTPITFFSLILTYYHSACSLTSLHCACNNKLSSLYPSLKQLYLLLNDAITCVCRLSSTTSLCFNGTNFNILYNPYNVIFIRAFLQPLITAIRTQPYLLSLFTRSDAVGKIERPSKPPEPTLMARP